MNCQNRYCVYWKENACVLENISLDTMGICERCVLIRVSETYLEEQRETLRSLMEE